MATPMAIHGSTITTGAVASNTLFEGARIRDKSSELLSLIGSWQGDDFQSCLGLVYAARSVVDLDHVST